MTLDSRQEQELTGGVDTLLHYHANDRGPFPIPHGAFYDTTTQSAASTTVAYPITYNTTLYSKGVSLATTSRVLISTTGTYNIQFSCQLENPNVQDQDVEVWLSENGTNVVDSSTLIDVPQKHGGVDGHTVAAWNFFRQLQRGDYFELYWQTSSTAVIMPYRAATTSPTRPGIASAILTVNLVSI